MRLTIVGLRGASWGFVGLRGASWGFVGLRGTFVGLRGILEGVRGASWNLRGSGTLKTFVEPSWGPTTPLHKGPCGSLLRKTNFT